MSSHQVHEEVLEPRTLRQRFETERGPLSFRAVLQGWAERPAFVSTFVAALRACPYEAVFWECRPLTERSQDAPYEHVLVDAPRLARVTVDEAPFASHLRSDAPVVTFENLGGDATLVVPTPRPGCAYPHLLAFLRTAAEAQAQAFFRALSVAIPVGPSPRWVSTSGLGVYYVHARVDTRPKYYVHRPYREGPGDGITPS